MSSDEKNLLTIKEYYLIRSSITKKPYIDRNYSCYLFEAKSEADTFCKSIPNTYPDMAKFYTQRIFGTEFYGYGIKNIKVKPIKADKTITIAVSKEDAKKHYYAPKLTSNILRIKQTKEKAYLREIKDEIVLVPCQIEPRYEKNVPKIYYCLANIGNKDYYVAFSALKEFNEWNNSNNCEWQPMGISLSKLKRIRKNSPIIINPETDALILTNDNLVNIMEQTNA